MSLQSDVGINRGTDRISTFGARPMLHPLDKPAVDFVLRGRRMAASEILPHNLHAEVEQVERRRERAWPRRWRHLRHGPIIRWAPHLGARAPIQKRVQSPPL